MYTAQMLPKRKAGAAAFQIPAGSLDRRFRHAMAAHLFHQSVDARCVPDLVAHNHWREKIFQSRPGSIRPFFTIERTFARRTLAPTFSSVGTDNAHEDDAALSRASKAGFEKVDEWQADFAQLNRSDDHKLGPL